jgi:UDP-glucuronate 4-epimerase
MPLRVIDSILNDKTIEKFDGGTLQRDWTYVEDILNGIVAALERPLGYQIMNLGNGAPITLNAFIRTLEYLIEKEAITVDVPTPLTEPRITYCDNSRARQLLDFDPKVGVEEGLARTWAWYQERFLNGQSG